MDSGAVRMVVLAGISVMAVTIVGVVAVGLVAVVTTSGGPVGGLVVTVSGGITGVVSTTGGIVVTITVSGSGIVTTIPPVVETTPVIPPETVTTKPPTGPPLVVTTATRPTATTPTIVTAITEIPAKTTILTAPESIICYTSYITTTSTPTVTTTTTTPTTTYQPPTSTPTTTTTRCDIPGLCRGQLLHFDTSADMVACLSLCKSTAGCSWFSFHTIIDQTCILFEDCPEIESNPQFVSGQKECDYDCKDLQERLNELVGSRTKNISAWDINVSHGQWSYPDPDPSVPDVWSSCGGGNKWYGWNGSPGNEDEKNGSISTILPVSGKVRLGFGNC
jgi:hypothetical protein